MNTITKAQKDIRDSEYLESQPEIQSIIKGAIELASNELSEDSTTAIEEIECHSRDGFIRDSTNFGGYEATAFDYLSTYFGSGLRYSSDKANKVLDSQVEYNLNAAKESFIDDNLPLLEVLKIKPKQVNYHDLCELGHDDLAEELSNLEMEMFSDDTIMLTIRVMYNGIEDGKHIAEVSSTINWESPYHRSSGAVYRNVGVRMETEVVKVVNIAWTNNEELKTQLEDALKTVKEIF